MLLLMVFFTSSPGQETWRFIATDDSRGATNGINLTILKEIVAEIKKQGVDLFVCSGDLVSSSEPAEFETNLRAWINTMKPVYDANIAIYVCRGNHELRDIWQSDPNTGPDPDDNYAIRWLNVFGNDLYPVQKLPANGPAGERYMTYSVTHKNALIVLLDEYAGTAHKLYHRINQKWLDTQLAANTKPHIFVAGHEPAFQTFHDDCLDNFPANRDALWVSLANSGARTYLCGHDHFYDHARVNDGDGDPNNDIHQYIIGTAGARPYHWSPPYRGDNGIYTIAQLHHAERYGYVLVEVDDLDVTLTWMERSTNDLDTTGVYEANDSWSYSVTPRPIVLSPNGGEKLAAANTCEIRWKTLEGAQIDYAKIEHSIDNGQNWEDVTVCENAGFYQWHTPAADSNQCRVRISDLSNPAISDTSDRVFTIFQCRKVLAGDINGDCYVNFLDFSLLIEDWLKCTNPFDPACNEPQ